MREVSSLPGQGRIESAEEHDIDKNTLGMWVFLSTEVLFFGALFTAYFIYRFTYPEAFVQASQHTNTLLGSINTAILLTSSFFMALAVMSAQLRRRRGIMLFLAITLLLGLVFLGIKGYEYSLEFSEHLFPGSGFVFKGPNAGPVKIFFSLYFVMTGLHAVHMLIGMSLITVMILRAGRHHFDHGHYAPVELVGLFWHFVDIVWIFIFPLLYLIHKL